MIEVNFIIRRNRFYFGEASKMNHSEIARFYNRMDAGFEDGFNKIYIDAESMTQFRQDPSIPFTVKSMQVNFVTGATYTSEFNLSISTVLTQFKTDFNAWAGVDISVRFRDTTVYVDQTGATKPTKYSSYVSYTFPDANLIAAWDLTRFNNAVNNLVNGGTALTIPAAPSAPTPSGRGFIFDGTNDYLSGDQYPLSNKGTLIVVAHTALSFPGTDPNNWRGLLGKSSSGNAAGTAYMLEWNGDATTFRVIRLVLSNGTAFNATHPFFNFNFQNKFHCLAGRWTGSLVSVWIDGVKKHEVAQTVNANDSLVAPIKVGQSFGTLANSWNGTIAYAAIFDTDLTDQQMLDAYNYLETLLYPKGVDF